MGEYPIFWLPDDVRAQMIALGRTQHPLETGGMLLGYANPAHVVVTTIIGPGPRARHSRHGFIPDAEYQQVALNAHFDCTEGKETYLGDWHTHPNGIARMSWLDKRTLTRIANETENLSVVPIMAILAGGPIQWEIKAFLHANRTLFGLVSPQIPMNIRIHRGE